MDARDRDAQSEGGLYMGRTPLENFSLLLRGDGKHAAIEAQEADLIIARAQIVEIRADYGSRIKELERKVRDLQFVLALAAAVLIANWLRG